MNENIKGIYFLLFILLISLLYLIIKNWNTIINEPSKILKYIGLFIFIIIVIGIYIYLYNRINKDQGINQFPVWLKLLIVLLITVVLSLIGYYLYKHKIDYGSDYFKFIFVLVFSFIIINYLDGGIAMYISAIFTTLTFMFLYLTFKLYEKNCLTDKSKTDLTNLYYSIFFVIIYFLIQNNKTYEAIILISLLYAYFNYESNNLYKTISVLFLMFSCLKLLFPTFNFENIFDNRMTQKLFNKIAKFAFISFFIINILYSLHVPSFVYYIILPIIFILLFIF